MAMVVADVEVSAMPAKKQLFMSRKTFEDALEQYMPAGTARIIAEWLESLDLRLTLWNHRKTKLGDFRPPRRSGERAAVSVNKSLNQYSFLITLVHEIAHAAVYEKYGRNVKPHGREWKNEYRDRLLVFIQKRVFPDNLEREVAAHLINPGGSVNANPRLEKLLRTFDETPDDGLVYVDELAEGQVFILPYNGATFIKGAKRRTRHHCIEKSSGKQFLISGMSRVKVVKS